MHALDGEIERLVKNGCQEGIEDRRRETQRTAALVTSSDPYRMYGECFLVLISQLIRVLDLGTREGKMISGAERPGV